jgi:pilus assembly protein Flp/PilA
MRRFCDHVLSFLKREDGPTTVEYAVILSLIISAMSAAIQSLGKNANQTFSFVGSNIKR